MANTRIQHKRTTTAGAVPTTSDISNGEIAINLTDGRLFTSNGSATFDAVTNVAVDFRITNNAGGALRIGNSTVNAVINSTSIRLANSTSNTILTIPSTSQWSATNVFLHANGSWVTITGGGGPATPAGANTQIQYNDSGAFGANVLFTFDQATTRMLIGNSSVNAAVNSTSLALANSTSNTRITIPTTVERSATNYFLHANGSWVQFTAGGSATPGGSNTHVQFNDSAAFGGTSGFTFNKTTNNVTMGGDLNVLGTASININTLTVGNNTVNVVANSTSITMFSMGAAGAPTAPAANNIVLFAREVAGRIMPAFMGPSGLDSSLQPHLGRNKIALYSPRGASGTVNQDVFGFSMANNLAGTSRTFSTTNLFTSLRRIGIATSTTAGTSGNIRHNVANFWRGNAANLGGFHAIFRFGISNVAANGRAFIGMTGQTAGFTNAEPSAQTNFIGVLFDAGQTTLRAACRGTGTVWTSDLGAGFPSNSGNTAVYELAIFARPNGGNITYQVTRFDVANVVVGTYPSANLPSTTTGLGWQVWVNNGSSAAAEGIDIISVYVETDY